jgi:histone H3/H4
MSGSTWMRCSACKRDIPFGATHWVCSVSTCNRTRTRLVFCSVACWDSHVAMLRHRDAWAVEAKAPTPEAWAAEEAARVESESDREETKPQFPPPGPQPAPRRVAATPPPPRTALGTSSELAETDREILVVVSKVKKYIKDRSGMNTSDAVAEMISEHVRAICDDAIRAAGSDGRKTVLDRDVPRPVRR